MDTQKLTTFENNGTFLLFVVNKEPYALKIDDILKLEKFSSDVVPLPLVNGKNQYMRGVYVFQGKSIAVFGLRKMLGLSTQESEMMIVVKSGERKIGLVVDELNGVERLEKQPLAETEQSDFIEANGIRDKRSRNRTENKSNQPVHIISTEKLYSKITAAHQKEMLELK